MKLSENNTKDLTTKKKGIFEKREENLRMKTKRK